MQIGLIAQIPMKILEAISYLYPAWSYGGPGKLVYEISSSLVAQKHEVVIFSTDAFEDKRRRRKSDDNDLKETGVEYFFFKNLSNILAYRYKIFLPLDWFFSMVKILPTVDIIHIHEVFTELAIVTSFFANFFNKPYIISAHGTLDQFHLSHRKNWKNLFLSLLGRRMFHGASAFVAATKQEEEEYEMLGIKKIYQVPNGIDLREFQNLPPHGLFRRKYKIPPKEKIVSYLGRINKLKGLDLLVAGFSEVSKRIPSHLIIAGSDDGYLSGIRQQTEKLHLERVIHFPGIVSGRDKLELYSDTDVFIYPSPQEGFSLAILEAAVCGLPLLITDGCKFPEVETYHAGIIIPYNQEQLKQSLLKLLQHDILRKTIGRNAKRLVEKNFSIEVMSRKLIHAYETISKSK